MMRRFALLLAAPQTRTREAKMSALFNEEFTNME